MAQQILTPFGALNWETDLHREVLKQQTGYFAYRLDLFNKIFISRSVSQLNQLKKINSAEPKNWLAGVLVHSDDSRMMLTWSTNQHHEERAEELEE